MAEHGREIIHIQVGKSGNAIGHEFWRDLCLEHKIDYSSVSNKGCYIGKEGADEEAQLDVFFNEGSEMQGKSRYVPRAILVDLNMHDLSTLVSDDLGSLYRPDNIIGNDEGSGNCYAKAFHTEGPDLADQVLENVRKEMERCNCLQGIQFVHNICGGTGSGLTGLLLKTLFEYLDKGSKCIMQSFCVVPAPGLSDVLIEPYNAVLGFEDLLEYCHQVFFYDNLALKEICSKTLEIPVPKMVNLNNIVARCMSGITASLRFPGILDADLRKIHTNIVPFKNAHFLITSHAPLTSPNSTQYRKVTILDLAQQMISKNNVTCKCDPLNPGDDREKILKSRFLASFAAFRGDIKSGDVDKVLYDLEKDGSRYDVHFPDWIPNSISSSICTKTHPTEGAGGGLIDDFDIMSGAGSQLEEGAGTPEVTFVSNNTAVHEIFDRVIIAWDMMHRQKSYLHVFEQDGISSNDMMESRNILRYVSDQYKEFAKWEDKLIIEKDEINEKAVLNEDQRNAAMEIKELTDCFITSAAKER